MRTVIGRLILALAALATAVPAGAQPAGESRYVSEAGQFSFSLPEGWEAIPREQIDAFNGGLPEHLRYQGGIVDARSTSPKVYMLLQVKRRLNPPAEDIKRFQEAAHRVDRLAAISDVIVRGEHKEKAEFYSPGYDAFLAITDDGGRLSVMAKHFTRYGYYLMHFYLGPDPVRDLAAIDHILSTLREQAEPAAEPAATPPASGSP